MKSALLLGASGLVGSHCLEFLLQEKSYGEIRALVRRPLAIQHPSLIQHIVDFDSLNTQAALLRADDIFCCLGTTIKKAGSQEAFRKVDFTYAYEIAKIAAQNGAQQFLLVSSMGANAKSSIFYNRVKGELEDAVAKLPFDGVQIFRPSLLIGSRAEFRLGEKIAEPLMKAFGFLLVGNLKKYRAIEARTVAAAMIEIAEKKPSGVNIYESDRIQEIGK